MMSLLSSGFGALFFLLLLFHRTVSALRSSKLIGGPTLRRGCRFVGTGLNRINDADSRTVGRPSPLFMGDSEPKGVGLGAWVPIGSRTALKGLCPTRVRVMGVDLVVWDDSSNDQWSVMRDVCSHKLAPLSQGRVNRETSPNCVECPYHGWQFGSDGALACIPQKSSNLSPALVEKASVEAYSVHVGGDLIWAFLPSSLHGESFPRDLLPEDYYHNGLRRDVEASSNFAVIELPASYDFYMENGMDPSHFSFAHHGVIANRNDAGPFEIEVRPSNFTHVSFQTQYQRKGETRT